MRNTLSSVLRTAVTLGAAALLSACTAGSRQDLPCDLYRAGGTPCVTAHSTARLLDSSYRGPLYRLVRASDGQELDIYPGRDGYADTRAHDAFCDDGVCYISVIYDQSGMGNDLLPAPPGTFQGPDKGGFNNPALADMAPALLDGHKVYGVYIMPGMGYRCNDARGLAVDDEPEGIYYVIDGAHYDSGCCFDYGNSSTNGRAVGTGTMETTYYGTSTAWGRGNGDGPWIMSDMEAGLFSGYGAKQNDVPSIDSWRFVSVFVNGGGGNHWDLRGADAAREELTTFYSGVRPGTPDSDAYYPMHKKGGMLLGNGGDNGNGSAGTFFEGAMTVGYPSDATLEAVQRGIAGAGYRAWPLSLSRITTFTPGAEQRVVAFFENTTGRTVKGLRLDASLPGGWTLTPDGTLPASIAPGERITAAFTLTAPAGRSAGRLRLTARWQGGTADASTRIRCAEAVKINEILLSDAQGVLAPYVELYNAGGTEADLSGLELIVRRSGWAPVRAGQFPAGTRLAPGAFLTRELQPETTPAPTTVFSPVSTGPKLDFPAGTTCLPATSVEGFETGQTLGIDLGGHFESVTITAVGTPATQSNLSRAARAGEDRLYLDATADLRPGDELTLDTGDRKETVRVRTVLESVAYHIRRFGEPDQPHEPGLIALEAPLQRDHAQGVDVSCPGSGISFQPATRFAHRSGDALQRYTPGAETTISATAGSVALSDPVSGVILDAVVYGSQQSNSSANGTITSPELATLEGDQQGGGCIAVVPQPVPAFLRARFPDAARTVCLVRMPDGTDTDQLCADFSLSTLPTPGGPNRKE